MPLPPKVHASIPADSSMVIAKDAVELSEVQASFYIMKQDFSGLNEFIRQYLCDRLSELYKLDPRKGFICCINANGKMIPYVKSAGISELTRDKVKNLTISMPTFLHKGSEPRAVTVICTVELIDGRTFQDVGSYNCTGDVAFDVMKAATRARSRALKLSVAIPLMSESELQEKK